MRATRLIACAFACTLATILVPTFSHAFGVSGFGGKVGYGVPEDLDGTLMFSGHVEFEHPGSRFHLLPSVGYWSEDDVSDLSANMDVYYHFAREGFTTPYLGAGLGVHFLRDDDIDDSTTDLGGNVFGGLRFPMSSSHLFMEARLAMSDISTFGVFGGVTLHP
jgi:hypothetical protein